MLVGKNFDDIEIADLKNLVDVCAHESINLEFKRDSYGNSDSAKKELLKDVSSIANSMGGHLIIGIDEVDGTASRICPVNDVSADDELLRLESIIRTGIEPNILGFRAKRLPYDGGNLFVFEIPRSANPPHRVIFKASNRFYVRHSAGVYEPSLEQLRELFGHMRTIEERVKSFANERFLQIQANDGQMPMPVEKGGVVLHLIPLPDFGGDVKREIQELEAQQSAFVPISATGYSTSINLDGLVIYRGDGTCHGYTQMFRNRTIEATSCSVFVDRDDGRMFGSYHLSDSLRRSINSYMNPDMPDKQRFRDPLIGDILSSSKS